MLAYPIFGLAHLALGFKGMKQRLVAQFAPLLVVTLALSPLLLAASHTKASPEAQDILFRIRSPHHYNPARFERNFMPFAAWQMLGIGSGWLLHKTADGRRLGAILCGLMITIWGRHDLDHAVRRAQGQSNLRLALRAERRLAVADLAVLRAGASARQAGADAFVSGRRARLGVRWARVFGLFFRGKENAPVPNLLLVFFAALLLARGLDLALDLGSRFLPAQANQLNRAKLLFAFLPLLLGGYQVYRLAPDRVEQARRRSNLLKDEHGATSDLYRWLREKSPKDAVYLTPPDLEDARFWGQRAIVVDWKAVPLIPTELLDWYERLCDVTGRRVNGTGDLGGYNTLDGERLALVVSKYHPDYLVLRRGGERRFGDCP